MRLFAASLLVCCSFIIGSNAVQADVYELRTYTTNEGKLDSLHARFRDHTMKLFEKHGMENVGYWVPTDDRSANTLIYVIKHKSRDAAKGAWAAFMKDADWQAAYKASVTDGALVKKVESVYMDATDYSPEFKSDKAEGKSVFELRTYTTNEGKLPNLNARFRDHTVKLFEKHGIQNVAYWTPADEPNSKNQLIYVIKHSSPEGAKKSWSAFASDPEWKKVAKESQKDGRILIKGGVKSTYMTATEYSPIK
ncbi:MAG: NIPSNAP family protein [Planctomycetota bacterium]